LLLNNRFDAITWAFMQTGLHKWLLHNYPAWVIFDIVFYSMPLLYFLLYKVNELYSVIAAVIMLCVNFIYIQCYTLYPANSIESFTPWLLFPCLFITRKTKDFYLVLNGLRYFFLYFFCSAAVWKFVLGGIFNIHQMSAILLYQHKEYIASSPNGWFTNLVYWLVAHPYISYALYTGAAIVEFSFLVGFFTKKYDKIFIVAFILFLLLDLFLMRIPYWEVTPFLITLVYSRYAQPAEAL